MQSFDWFSNELHHIEDLVFPNLSDEVFDAVAIDWDETNFDLAADFAVEIEQKEKEISAEVLCIHQRLRHLYVEEWSKERYCTKFRRSAHLLEKLVERETFNMVMVTLYPANKGYTISLCNADGRIFQESHQPYSQQILLDYIDKEELPPSFLEYWESTFPELFYHGCVLVKVKDLRFSTEPHIRHTILRPHTQSIINDVNLIILEDEENWSTEDKVCLESSVVNIVQGPLCLDPDPNVGIERLRIDNRKNFFNTPALHDVMRRTSQPYMSLKRKLDQRFHNKPNKSLIQCLAKKKPRDIHNVPTPIVNKEPAVVCSSACSNVLDDINRLARPITLVERNEEYEIDYSPKLIEEYILEPEIPTSATGTEDSSTPRYHIKLTILQRPANSEYVGVLYVDKEYKEGQSNGSLCRFTLGSKDNVDRYIEQFTDIFTEEGGKSVRITHLVPGQPARETSTASFEREPKNHTFRIQNHGKTFMQIGTVSNVNAIQQNASFNTSANRSSIPQYQPAVTLSTNGNATGDLTTLTTNNNNAILTLLSKTNLATSQSLNCAVAQQQKIIARKIIANSRIRPVFPSVPGASIRIPIALSRTSVPEQTVNSNEVAIANIHQGVNTNQTNINMNKANLKNVISGTTRNIASLHNLSGNLSNLESGGSLQSNGVVQTVHIVSGTKEKNVSNFCGQNSSSNLSLTLPGLSALLADIEGDNT